MSGYARVDFDTVAPLMPFDKTAGRVAARGESFEWQPPADVLHTSNPITTRRPTGVELRNSQFADLSGRKVGRFTVIGIAEVTTCNGQNWVVRCVCGSYETRKAKTIKAAMSGNWKDGHEPMCGWCCKNRHLQRGGFNAKKAAAAEQAIQELAR